MGICASCFGLNRRQRYDEDSETSRLLYDDPNQAQYGSVGHGGPGGKQPDPQDIQRETEALQKIVAQTSDNLIDIFALQPTSTLTPPHVAGLEQETHLPKSSSPTPESRKITPVPFDALDKDERAWLDQLAARAERTLYGVKGVTKVRAGDLVGGLAVARVAHIHGKEPQR